MALVGCSHSPPVLSRLDVAAVVVAFCFYRVRELLAARMVVDKFLPFSHFSGSWEELIGTVTTEGQCTPFPALTSRRVKHLVVEMFVATKKVGVLPPVRSVPLFCFRPSPYPVWVYFPHFIFVLLL